MLNLQKMQPLSNVGHWKDVSRTMKFSNRFLRQTTEKKIAAAKILMKLKQHMICKQRRKYYRGETVISELPCRKYDGMELLSKVSTANICSLHQ
jgi:hypothetical protein